MRQEILDSIKNKECAGCHEGLRSITDGPFCSNRCSMFFDERAPIHLIQEVYKAYQQAKDEDGI